MEGFGVSTLSWKTVVRVQNATWLGLGDSWILVWDLGEILMWQGQPSMWHAVPRYQHTHLSLMSTCTTALVYQAQLLKFAYKAATNRGFSSPT